MSAEPEQGAAERPDTGAAGTTTIYARVPAGLKTAVDAYAHETGKTLAGAVAELVGRGLAAGPAAGEAVTVTRVELDIACFIARIAQIHTEAEPEHWLWDRIITCDVPRLRGYLGPWTEQLLESGFYRGEKHLGCGSQCSEAHTYSGSCQLGPLGDNP